MDRTHQITVFSTFVTLVLWTTGSPGWAYAANLPPVAEAGLPRYAAKNPVQLDASGSYDPDHSGPLTYAWTQVSGPPVVIAAADTATPTVGGFVQTSSIQECVLELVVSDGELTSSPDTVKIIIVPWYGDTLKLENKSFDPNKPTFIFFFGGYDCVRAWAGPELESLGTLDWRDKANVIDFPNGWSADPGEGVRTYYHYGDMIIAYLSAVAPHYTQPIQTAGWGYGGQPAIDVGLRLNLAYGDARYAVNRVTFLMMMPSCRDYSESIRSFLASSVDGEQCWIDNYDLDTTANFYPNVLNVAIPMGAIDAIPVWYLSSLFYLTHGGMNRLDSGVAAGAYLSPVGPGKNLQLADTPDEQTYKFRWVVSASSGYLDYFDLSASPGRLPEPVTLYAWSDAAEPADEPSGAILTCEKSDNAVGYQLLFGPDPYRVMDYNIVSDTPTPPLQVIHSFPFEETWWTIKVRDAYGSTIYADPIRVDLASLPRPTVQNLRTGQRCGCIQVAIDQAEPGDEIVVPEGVYYEDIRFRGRNLTLRSTDPNNFSVATATVVQGGGQGPVVTLSGGKDTGCVLAGLTVRGSTVGVSCREAAPTIRNCIVLNAGSTAIEFWWGCQPRLIDCRLSGKVKEGGDLGLVAYWKLDEAQGTIAADSISGSKGTLMGSPLWQPAGGKVGGALQFDGIDDYVKTPAPSVVNPGQGAFSVLAWVKGGAPGQVIFSQMVKANWLSTDASTGWLMTELKAQGSSGTNLQSPTVVTDGNWHRVGLTWDGNHRTLYVDDVEVARDTQPSLPGVSTALYIGAGSKLSKGTFWSGLIDDVRIYNRAVTP